MPWFDETDVHRLVAEDADTDFELDLRGCERAWAEAALERDLNQRGVAHPSSLLIRLDPPSPASGETLFLPIGRQLLAAQRQGLVTRFRPVADLGNSGSVAGFRVELPGRPAPGAAP